MVHDLQICNAHLSNDATLFAVVTIISDRVSVSEEALLVL